MNCMHTGLSWVTLQVRFEGKNSKAKSRYFVSDRGKYKKQLELDDKKDKRRVMKLWRTAGGQETWLDNESVASMAEKIE